MRILIAFYGGQVDPVTELPAHFHAYQIQEQTAPWDPTRTLATIIQETPNSPMPDKVHYVANSPVERQATQLAIEALSALPQLHGLTCKQA